MRSFCRFYLLLALMTLLVGASRSAAQAPQFDLLLQGGHVIDPANNLDAVLDVATAGDSTRLGRTDDELASLYRTAAPKGN